MALNREKLELIGEKWNGQDLLSDETVNGICKKAYRENEQKNQDQ